MKYCTHPDHLKPGRIPWVLADKCVEHEPKPQKPRYRLIDGKFQLVRAVNGE